MKKQSPSLTATRSDIEVVRLVGLAAFVSFFSFLFYYRHGDVLLYGDAVAHINIARRVFDSKTPGLLQLGTVWLPLPHLLIMPFILAKQMWQTGSGGSIPSMAGYVFGVMGIFRLVRWMLNSDGEANGGPKIGAKIEAWAAAVIYGANPNLIYMQATAMGEALYLAFFIWAVVHFAEFARGGQKALIKCGACVAAACLTRYDGWFLAAGLVIAVPLVSYRFNTAREAGAKSAAVSLSRTQLLKFSLLAASGPVLWLAYNAAVYRNPLEFANGPYSAKAIEQKTATVNPAKGSVLAAGSYFLKAAELNVGESTWLGRLWLAFAILGSLLASLGKRSRIALLLWAPLPFYASSVAYGSVPIFVPAWWPRSLYNVRYGLQLLPAFAVFVPLAIVFLTKSLARIPQIKIAWPRWAGAIAVLATLLFAAASYGAIWRADPICLREAATNMSSRIHLDKEVATWIAELPPHSTLLMYLGEHVGALEQAGFDLKRTINEGNRRVWKRPTDPEGLWERSLADPAAYADYAIAFEGDPVWTPAREHHLTALVELHTTGQPPAVIFQCRPQAKAE
jgi:hypothetical protein